MTVSCRWTRRLSAVAVIGPIADSRAVLQGNYNGTASRQVTILEGIEDLCAGKARCPFEGCPLWRYAAHGCAFGDRLAEAVSLLLKRTLGALGLDPSIEGEEGDASNEYGAGDKNHSGSPGLQQLLEKVVAVGKPTILVRLRLRADRPLQRRSTAMPSCRAGIPARWAAKAVAELLFRSIQPERPPARNLLQERDDLPPSPIMRWKAAPTAICTPFRSTPSATVCRMRSSPAKTSALRGSIASGDSIDATVTVRNDSDIPRHSARAVVFLRDEEASTRAALLALRLRAHRAEPASRQVSVRIAPRAMELVTEEGERASSSGSSRSCRLLDHAPDGRSARRPACARFPHAL